MKLSKIISMCKIVLIELSPFTKFSNKYYRTSHCSKAREYSCEQKILPSSHGVLSWEQQADINS